jgi:predicted dehydrogenase
MSEKNQAGNISRRDFAKMSAAAGFAILSSRGAVAANNSETIKIGLIGSGGRGYGAAINCLTGNKNVKLIAVADAFEERAKGAAERLKTKTPPAVAEQVDIAPDHIFTGLDAYKKLLATDIDMIIHATPPYARPTQIMAAVDAGKHIFTEKPIAVDAAGVRLFIDAANKAKEKKLSFVTGLQRRHQKEYVETIKQIHDGKIGDILAARAYWNGTLPFAHDRKEGEKDLAYRLRNWYNNCWTCGDNIVEQHIHNLDVINWALNAHPIKVVASGGRTWKPYTERYGDIWDSFSCDYEYPNGVHVISMSRHWANSANGVFEEVTGVKGKSTCTDLGKPGTDPYVQEHIDLLASIRGEGEYLNEGVRTAESTLTAIMGRDAAYSGKELSWEEALNAKRVIGPAYDELDWEKNYPNGPLPVPGEYEI